MAQFGALFGDATVKLEQHPDLAYENLSYAREKVGEIYRLSPAHLSFECSHCDKQFPLIIQFIDHIQSHLMHILTDSIESQKNTADINVKAAIGGSSPSHSVYSDGRDVDINLSDCSSIEDDNRKHKAETNVKPEPIESVSERPQVKRTDVLLRTNKSRRIWRNAKYECYICRISYSTKLECSKHLRESHISASNPSYQCLQCSFSTSNKDNLRKHSIACTGEDRVCGICGQMFADKHIRLLHIQTHNKKFQCDTCGQQYRTNSKLKVHMASHSDQALYQCDECPKAYKFQLSLMYHKRAHRGILPYKCDVCDKGFHQKVKLNAHRWEDHGVPIDGGQLTETATCNICNKTLSNLAHLKRHLLRHTGLTLRCSQCSVCCATPSELRKHLASHSDLREFVCDQCPRSFNRKDNLVAHKRLHANNTEPFRCAICDKTMTTARILLLHMRRHTGEDLMQCPHCEHRSPSQGELDKHLVMHSTTRDFQCDLCPKAFKRNSHLISHRKIHLGEYSHTCKWCEKGFRDKRSLVRHSISKHKRAWDEMEA